MPVVVGEVHDHRHEHGEGLVLVRFQNVEEVIVLEEAHGPVCHLQMNPADALHYPFEELQDEVLHLVDFTDLEYFLQFSEEERFFNAVCERPVPEEAVEQLDRECPIFCEEKHRTPEELLVELLACLDLVERDDHILEEEDVLVSQGHGEAGNDAG